MSRIKQLLKSPRLLTPIFKRFLKYVPGFRSGEKVNMIVASIYYICCVLFLIIGLLLLDSRRKAGCVSISGSAILFPLEIFSIIDISNRTHEN